MERNRKGAILRAFDIMMKSSNSSFQINVYGTFTSGFQLLLPSTTKLILSVGTIGYRCKSHSLDSCMESYFHSMTTSSVKITLPKQIYLIV